MTSLAERRCSANPAPCGCSTPIRRTTQFSGQVQGVGFRATTREIAARFRITGTVRNLPDGRVELVAEGTEIELDRFEAAIETAMLGQITEMQSSDGPATGEFRGFSIGR